MSEYPYNYDTGYESEEIEIPADSVLKVSRVEPMNHRGFYRSFPVTEIDTIEERIAQLFGGGRFEISISHRGRAIQTPMSVEIPGDPLDKHSQPILTGQQAHVASVGNARHVAAGAINSEYFQMQIAQNNAQNAKLQRELREAYEERDAANKKATRLEMENELLKSRMESTRASHLAELDRAKQHFELQLGMERQKATFEKPNGENKLLESLFPMIVSQAFQKQQAPSLSQTIMDMKAIKELTRDDDEPEPSGGVLELGKELVKQIGPVIPSILGQSGVMPAAAANPALNGSDHFADENFCDLLQDGCMNGSEASIWAKNAMKHVTPVGREALKACQANVGNLQAVLTEAFQWSQHVKSLDVEAMAQAVQGDIPKLQWLAQSFIELRKAAA